MSVYVLCIEPTASTRASFCHYSQNVKNQDTICSCTHTPKHSQTCICLIQAHFKVFQGGFVSLFITVSLERAQINVRETEGTKIQCWKKYLNHTRAKLKISGKVLL